MGSIIIIGIFAIFFFILTINLSNAGEETSTFAFALCMVNIIVMIFLITNAVDEAKNADKYLEQKTIQSVMLQEQINHAELLYGEHPDAMKRLYEETVEFNKKVSDHQAKVGNWWSGSQHQDYWLNVPLVEFNVEFSINNSSSSSS